MARKPNMNLLVMLLLIFLFMLIAGNLFGQEEFSSSRISTTLLGFLALIIILLLFFRLMVQPPSIPKTRIITVLECEKCNVKNIRDFKQGDYIPKQDGKCPRCEGPMRVEAIYSEGLPKEKPKFKF